MGNGIDVVGGMACAILYRMKRLLIFSLLLAGTAGAVTKKEYRLPDHNPMFDGMIVRCEPDGKCHWECEFGVVTSTVMVKENLVVEPSGCAEKSPNVIIENSPPTYRWNNLIPL